MNYLAWISKYQSQALSALKDGSHRGNHSSWCHRLVFRLLARVSPPVDVSQHTHQDVFCRAEILRPALDISLPSLSQKDEHETTC